MIESLYGPFRKWSEKGSVMIISDTHFEDFDRDVMGYSISDEEQAEILRRTCHKFDVLVHLGDVGNPEFLKSVRSRKVLIMGNHDQSAERFEPYFDEIYQGPLIIGERILLSHEPVFGIPFLFNFHGHDHNPENRGDAFHMNLASNVCGYRPINLGAAIKGGVLRNVKSIHRMTIDEAAERKRVRNEEREAST